MADNLSSQAAPGGEPIVRGARFRKASRAWKVMLWILVLIVAYLLMFVVPKFAQVYHDMLGNDPSKVNPLARFIVSASFVFKSEWYFIAAALILWGIVRLVIALFRRGRPRPPARDTLSRDRLLTAVMTVLLIAVPIIILVALFMPVITIIEYLHGN